MNEENAKEFNFTLWNMLISFVLAFPGVYLYMSFEAGHPWIEGFVRPLVAVLTLFFHHNSIGNTSDYHGDVFIIIAGLIASINWACYRISRRRRSAGLQEPPSR